MRLLFTSPASFVIWQCEPKLTKYKLRTQYWQTNLMRDHTVRISYQIRCVCVCCDRGRQSGSWRETAARWLRLTQPGAFTPSPLCQVSLQPTPPQQDECSQIEGTPEAHSHIIQPGSHGNTLHSRHVYLTSEEAPWRHPRAAVKNYWAVQGLPKIRWEREQ